MIVTGYLEIGLLCHIQWLRICAAMSLRIPVLFGCINILRQISRPGLLVLASDCDWCYTLQTSLRYAAFGGHVHTKDDAAGATYFILHLTVNQGSDGLLGACLITTYDCDMTSITAPSLAILLTGGGTYSSRRDDGICGCFTYGRSLVPDAIFYLGACL